MSLSSALVIPNTDVVITGSGMHGLRTDFFERFGTTLKTVMAEGYRPLFLAIGSSSSGEVATSFGLFEKDGQLWEVNGSECSVWDFNGQWEPEVVPLAALRHRLERGTLGMDDGHDNFASSLRAYLGILEAAQPAKKQDGPGRRTRP